MSLPIRENLVEPSKEEENTESNSEHDDQSQNDKSIPSTPEKEEEWSATAVEMAHWSVFGRRGRRSPTRIRPSASKKLEPFLSEPRREEWDIPIPFGTLGKLLNGFLPQEMEDKLFIYADGPDTEGNIKLHFHRSWTGKKEVECEIKTTGDQKDEAEAWKSEFKSIAWVADDEIDEEMAKYIVLEACHWLLGVKLVENIEIPAKWKDLPPGKTIKMEPVAPPGGSKTVYKRSMIDEETLQDLIRLGAGAEIKLVQGTSSTSVLSEAV
ncbi:hypothetical protein BGZ60DRAFT_416981 [Tricladium varicosporioides]|nr:hypothetical protein BGZ60DRAFT_416981 [Hymenoscyphus varicosporioides]